MPVSIPNEVYLVTMPRGGQDDYQALLHESGHAEHMATTDASLPFEFKHLGDISVSETYAFLFHYLTTDREWLSQFVRMKGNDLDEFIRFACLNKLYMLRRYSAKLRYELDLHTGSPGRLQRGGELYSKHLGEVLMFKHRENLYLSDMDDGFYSAQYLRAWVFEAQLRAVMKEKFGRMWFSSIDAGKYLKGLYALGQKYTVEELAERAGVGKLSPRPLENEIREALG